MLNSQDLTDIASSCATAEDYEAAALCLTEANRRAINF